MVAVLAVATTDGRVVAGARAPASAVGRPSPEWTANAGARPARHNDLSHTRATTPSPIDSRSAPGLKVKGRFSFRGADTFGVFSSTPISLHGIVSLQDLNSNGALDRSTGKVKREDAFNQPGVGANGVATTPARPTRSTQTGKTLWTTKTPAGIKSFPAIDGDTLLVGAGTTGFHKNPTFGSSPTRARSYPSTEQRGSPQ
jgi:hypothetical protein